MRFYLTLVLVLVSAAAFAAPQFEMIGQPIPVGNDEFQFEYKLTNFGGPVPIYDIEFEYSLAAAWIRVNGPNGWAMNWESPLARWQTEESPCAVETELYGFYIFAGGPQFTMSPITFTDVNHMVVAAGEAPLPVPEPSTLMALSVGLPLLFFRRRSAG